MNTDNNDDIFPPEIKPDENQPPPQQNPEVKNINPAPDDKTPADKLPADNKPPETPPAKIDIQEYDSDRVNKEQVPDSSDLPNSPLAQTPPLKQPINRLVTTVVSLTVLVLVLGFGAGYFGFRYGGRLFLTSADPNNTSVGSGESTSADQNLSTYANTQYNYSIKYPNTWVGEGIKDPQSETLALTSVKSDSTTTLTGNKVTVAFQDAQGKTLKDWIEANNTTAKITENTLTQLQVDGKSAYQQTVTTPTKSINTYILVDDKVMTVSFSSAESEYDAGTKIYNQILESIKFNS